MSDILFSVTRDQALELANKEVTEVFDEGMPRAKSKKNWRYY